MRISVWSSDVCSSDLRVLPALQRLLAVDARIHIESPLAAHYPLPVQWSLLREGHTRDMRHVLYAARSEEHTSELQSLMRISYAVFCLKKKKNTNHQINTRRICKYTKQLKNRRHQ